MIRAFVFQVILRVLSVFVPPLLLAYEKPVSRYRSAKDPNEQCASKSAERSKQSTMRSIKRVTMHVVKTVLGFILIFFLLKFGIALVGKENKAFPASKELQKLMLEAEMDNNDRLSTIKNVCKEYNLGIYKRSEEKSIFKEPPVPQYSVFYIDRVHNISYCPIYKAGSTTWLHNLCLLLNVPEEVLDSGKEQISTIARRVIPEMEYPEAEEALKTTKRLLVVRHPFERLLSAYRDKLENSVAGREHGTLHFYRKYGAEIVRKYRDGNFTKPRAHQVLRRPGDPSPAGIEPTWREFVRYLIHTDLSSYADDHWIPYYLYCTPCSLEYDIVAKVESLWRDQIYAIKKFGLENQMKPHWRHGSGYSNSSKIYFSQLSKDLVRKLFEKFRLDFELFGYSPEKYYSYATSPE